MQAALRGAHAPGTTARPPDRLTLQNEAAAPTRRDAAASKENTGNCAEKRFATLRARLALAGFELSRTDASDGPMRYFVTRWSLVRELHNLTAVQAFAEQVGARHA